MLHCGLFLVFLPLIALADESDQISLPCSSTNNRLDPSTHKFISECPEKMYCSAAVNGTCLPRNCRRDDFPFGYSDKDVLPPKCPYGSFCPDEGYGCVPLLLPGSPCQLNRDEQCASPLDWKNLASDRNANGSICLQFSCMFANVSIGEPCITENTTYTSGQEYSLTITRDNCRTGLYCGQASMICEPTKPVGASCFSDQECELYNCAANVCSLPPDTPFRVAAWQYGVAVTSIVGTMIATFMMLILLHKRQRFERYKQLREYYTEQISLRRSIIALHAASADSLLSEKLK